jgi:hypothetical protein
MNQLPREQQVPGAERGEEMNNLPADERILAAELAAEHPDGAGADRREIGELVALARRVGALPTPAVPAPAAAFGRERLSAAMAGGASPLVLANRRLVASTLAAAVIAAAIALGNATGTAALPGLSILSDFAFGGKSEVAVGPNGATTDTTTTTSTGSQSPVVGAAATVNAQAQAATTLPRADVQHDDDGTSVTVGPTPGATVQVSGDAGGRVRVETPGATVQVSVNGGVRVGVETRGTPATVERDEDETSVSVTAGETSVDVEVGAYPSVDVSSPGVDVSIEGGPDGSVSVDTENGAVVSIQRGAEGTSVHVESPGASVEVGGEVELDVSADVSGGVAVGVNPARGGGRP